MRVERETRINAPPDAVYDLVMDPGRLGDWVTIHDGFKEPPPGVLEKGSGLVQRLKVAGRGFTVRWTVTEAKRPKRVRWEGRGPAGTKAQVAYSFAADGDGTLFTYLNEYELPGGPAGMLAGRAVSGAAAREVERSLERLRELLGRS